MIMITVTDMRWCELYNDYNNHYHVRYAMVFCGVPWLYNIHVYSSYIWWYAGGEAHVGWGCINMCKPNQVLSPLYNS